MQIRPCLFAGERRAAAPQLRLVQGLDGPALWWLSGYAAGRDRPDVGGTSRLSPYQ